MEKSPISYRSLFLSLGFSSIILLILFIKSTSDKSTIIVFCDVGQGDSIYIRIRNKIDVIIDAGPNRAVLSCLGKYMPFFDRKIEMAILTHFQKDHFGGFKEIVDRYKIDKFLTAKPENENYSSQIFNNQLNQKHIQIIYPTSKTIIKLLDAEIKFFWPNNTAISASKDNESSLIFQFQEKKYKILFTGDTTKLILDKLKYNIDWRETTVLKIPHHGSKNGLSSDFLRLADPVLAVISVGKNNPYGHPSSEVLDMLKAQGTRYERTDIKGNIVLKIP